MSEEYQEYARLIRAGSHAEAAALAEERARRAEGARERAFWLTRLSAALGRQQDYEGALKAARGALELESDSSYAVYAAGEALAGLSRHAEAVEHFDEAAREGRLGERARCRALDSLQAQGRWEEILSRLGALRLPEERSIGYRVKALVGLHRDEEAAAACARWLELKPHHPAALWELAEIEARRDGEEAARDRWARKARIPSLPSTYREIYASLCRRTGRTEEAAQEYERMSASGGSRVQRKHAFLLAKSGREREAVPLLEELLRSSPSDVYLHSSYAAACRRIGEQERAINFYNTLLGVHPEQKGLYGRIARLRRDLESKGSE